MNDAQRAFDDEQRRQVDALTQSFDAAIMEVRGRFEAPMLNALAGALAGQLVNLLCSIEDGPLREAFHKHVARAIAQGVQSNTKFGGSMRVETIVIGGARQ